ncbi:MAG: methyl-accepting chemotaxis protein [Phycisphaerales bacterium]
MNFLTNRSVGQQLLIGFGGLMLLLVVVATTGVGLVRIIEYMLPNEEIIAKQRCAINFRGSVHDRAISLRDVVLLSDDSELPPVLKEIEDLTKDYADAAVVLDQYLSQPDGASPEELRIAASIEETESKTLPVIEQVIALRKAHQHEEANRVLMTVAKPLFVEWLARINQFIDLAEATNQTETALARERSAGVQMLMGILAAASLAIGCFLAVLITRGLTRPIRTVLGVLQKIADGDLSQKPIGSTARGELGDLSRSTDTMCATLRDLIGQVLNATGDVSEGASNIASATGEIASGVDQQARQLEQITAAVEELNSSVHEVSRKSSDANGAAQNSGQLASTGGNVMSRMISDIGEIEVVVNSAANSVNELGQRSEEIGRIVAVINDIADQTNLLALNAAIEAARAGEHGRGFAVVADEVRKLADRTTKATDEIAQSIESIRAEISGAVSQIDSGTHKVKQGVTRADEANDNLRSIMTSAQDVAAMISSIAAAAEEQSSTAAEIGRSIDTINGISQQSASSTRQVAETASRLSEKTSVLQNAVKRFRM